MRPDFIEEARRLDGSARYRAFISYSHQDKQWGDWLHKALERYQIPKRLIGTQARDGEIPAKLFPIFRDREELPSSADLGSQISQALRDSAYLVVICSPRSASSRWVNEEILSFKRLGKENRILALIVDGEPNVSDKPDVDHSLECFPQALRFKLGTDGELSDEPAEPIAADARQHGDGKENAKLKLIAGLLGVGFDDLKQRELEAARQRLRVTRIIAGSMALLAVVAAISAFYAYDQRGFALEQRDAAIASERRVTRQAARVQLKSAYAAPKFEQEFARLALALKLDPDNSNLAFQALSRLGLMTWTPLKATVPARDSAVNALAYTPEGKAFVTASGNRVQRWHVDSGEPLGTAIIHAGTVHAIAISTDGRHIVSTTADGTLRVSEASSGKQLQQWRAHQRRIRSISLSRDGRMIATGSNDGSVRLWSMAAEPLGAPIEMGAAVQRVAFSPDGHYVAVGSAGTVSNWAVQGRQPLFAPRQCGEHAVINVLKYSDDGQYIAAGCTSGASVWQAQTGELLGSHRAHKAPVFELAISPDSTRIATGSIDNTAQLWDMVSGEKIGRTMGHDNAITALEYSANGEYLMTGSADGTVRLWSAKFGEGLRVSVPLWHYGSITHARFNPVDNQLLVGTQRGQIKLWDSIAADKYAMELKHDAVVWSLAFDPLSNALWTGGADGLVRRWDVRTGKPHEVTMPHGGTVLSLAASSDGKWIVSGGAPHTVRLWDVHSGALMPHEFQHTNLVDKVGISPDGGVIAAMARNSAQLMLWDLQTGALVQAIDASAPLLDFTFGGEGQRILVASTDGRVRLWDSADAAFLPFDIQPLDGSVGPVRGSLNAAVMSPDGALLLTATKTSAFRGAARLWDANTGKPRSELLAHETSVKHAAFSADGTRFVTVTQDGAVQVWDTATAQRIGDVISQRDTIAQAVFDRGGGRVITLSLGQKLQLWDVDTNTPLGQSYKHSDFFNAPRLSADGRLIATGGQDGVVRLVTLPSAKAAEVPLLAELLELYSGLTVNDRDALEPVQPSMTRLQTLRSAPVSTGASASSDVDRAISRLMISVE